MAKRVPADVREHAVVRLAEYPYGTRLVIAWDPNRWLPDDQIVDGSGREWKIMTYDGNDLELSSRWRLEAGVSPRIVLRLAPPLHDRNREVDISYLGEIVQQAEQFLDLSIAGVLADYAPDEPWDAGVTARYAQPIGNNLRRAVSAYRELRSSSKVTAPLAETHLRAMALSSKLRDERVPDLLLESSNTQEWLRAYLGIALRLQDSELVPILRDQAVRTARNSSAKAWAAAPLDEAVKLLYIAQVFRALNVKRDALLIRGLALLSDPDSLMEALPATEGILEDESLRTNVEKRAETSISESDVERILSVKDQIKPAETARALASLPTLATRILLRREMLKAAALDDPLAFVAQWERRPAIDERDGSGQDSLAAALDLLKSVLERLGEEIPHQPDMDALVSWYTGGACHLEYDLAEAASHIRNAKDEAVRKSWGKIIGSLRRNVREVLNEADRRLGELIEVDIPGFLRRRDLIINVARDLLYRRQLLPPKVPAIWLVVFDGMRWDTWRKVVRPLLEEEFAIQEERPYFALLPSITQISRTALIAGQPPSAWRDHEGKRTNSEERLGARGFNLKREQIRSSYRYVTRADADVRRVTKSGQKDRTAYNVLIYNVSDEWLHDYGQDVYQLNREVERRVREVILPDLSTFVREEDQVVIASDHGFIEMDREDGDLVQLPISVGAGAGPRPSERSITYRYVRDLEEVTGPKVTWQNSGSYVLAVGSRWFQRPGPGASYARYSHGGISLAELIVPGARLARVAAPLLKVEWRRLPPTVSIQEDEAWTGSICLANVGNRPVTFVLESPQAALSITPDGGQILPGVEARIDLQLRPSTRPGRTRVEVRGSFKGRGGVAQALPSVVIPVEVIERKDKVEFGDALDLLEDE